MIDVVAAVIKRNNYYFPNYKIILIKLKPNKKINTKRKTNVIEK